MEKSLIFNKNLINFGIPLLLFGLLIWLMKTTAFNGNDILDLAFTADLLFTVPLIYFLLIRKSKIPATTVIPVMVIGLLLGFYFLPTGSQHYLNLFKTWALPVVELSVLIFVIVKVRFAAKKYKSLSDSSADFFSALKSTCSEILPAKLVQPFATELAVIYYGFIKWKSSSLKENEFSYHQKSGSQSLFGAFILIIAVETVGLHYLIAQWNVVVAWVLTGLSIYTALQILGFAKSLSHRPVVLLPSSLHLKYGILSEATIPFADITSVELSWKPLEKSKLTRSLSPLGELESHNLIIHLKKENKLKGLYGMEKPFQTISLYIDNPTAFKNTIEDNLTK